MRLRLGVFPLALLLVLPGCQRWRGQPLPGASPSARQVPSPARVLLANGSSVVVWHGSVERDSLIGLMGPRAGERTRFAAPLAQVRRMDGRGVDVLATTALAAATTLALVLTSTVALFGGEW